MTEEQLHLYISCKRRYFYNQLTQELTPELDAAKYVFKHIFSLFDYKFPSELFNEYIETQELSEANKKWLQLKAPQQFETIINTVRIDYLHFIPSSTVTKLLSVNDSQIPITIDSIAKTDTGAYRGFVFTPLQFQRDIEWSPIHTQQYKLLRDLYIKDKYVNGQSAKLFILGFNKYKKKYFVHSIKKSIENQIHKDILSLSINNFKSNISTPNVPCTDFLCPFREICKP